MARGGEHQGLQIAVIIFVILTIALSITTFTFFKQSEEAAKKSAEDAARAKKADADLRNLLDEVSKMKTYIGVDNSDTIDKIGETYNGDMDAFASSLPLTARNYKVALTTLRENFLKADDERKQERVELNNLKTRIDQIETEFKNLLTAQTTEAKTAGQKLIEAQNEFKKQDDSHVKQKDDLLASKKTLQDELDQIKKDHESEVKKLAIDIKRIQGVNESQADVIEKLRDTTFEVADGEIRWVNQKASTVWVNLGRADSLPKQLTFSVWGRDENDVARRDAKAKIEVTQILGEHMAEARIVQDSSKDPILPGDKIYTPLWHPGRPERFALAGFIDINRDELSDLDMIKDLITMRGSAIDAVVGEDGKIVGPGLTLETRYLVLGKPPKQFVEKGYTEIQKQAREFGVQIITLEKFLDHMGWKDPNRVVQFGRSADARDFPPVKTDKSSGRRGFGTATSEVFKKRNPRDMPKKKDSAY